MSDPKAYRVVNGVKLTALEALLNQSDDDGYALALPPIQDPADPHNFAVVLRLVSQPKPKVEDAPTT